MCLRSSSRTLLYIAARAMFCLLWDICLFRALALLLAAWHSGFSRSGFDKLQWISMDRFRSFRAIYFSFVLLCVFSIEFHRFSLCVFSCCYFFIFQIHVNFFQIHIELCTHTGWTFTRNTCSTFVKCTLIISNYIMIIFNTCWTFFRNVMTIFL